MDVNYNLPNEGGGSSPQPSTPGAVRYDCEQSLTEEQKAQARENIGAASESDIPDPVQSDWNETDSDDPAFIKNKPTIPTVNNPTVTIKQGGTTKGTFTLNQGSAATIDLEAGGGEAVQSDWNETDTDDPAYIKNKPTIPTVNNPTVTIKQGGTTKGTFTLNQGSAATIDLDADTGTILIDTMSMMDEGGTISWSDMEDYGLSRSAYDGLPLGAIVTCTVQANKSLPIEYAPMSIRKLDANTGKAFAFAFLKNGSSMIAARCTITFEPDVVTAEFDTRILS